MALETKSIAKSVGGNGETRPLEWHVMPAAAVADYLGTALQSGLSTEAVRARQSAYGFNELREMPPTPLWVRFLEQLRNFVVLILIAAGLLSILLGDYVEAVAIMAIVLLNALLGVLQESRAETALTSLRRLAAPAAHVLRDSHHEEVPAREVVPGDVVLLAPGHYIPADMRLVESVNLRWTSPPSPANRFRWPKMPAANYLPTARWLNE